MNECFVFSCSISPTNELEEALPPAAQVEMTADTQLRDSSPQRLSMDELDVMSEKEGLT